MPYRRSWTRRGTSKKFYKKRYSRTTNRRSRFLNPGPPTLVVTNNSGSTQTGKYLNKVSTGLFRNQPTLWPDKFMTKMKYVDQNNLYYGGPQTASSPVNFVYRVNSLYDPATSVTGENVMAGFNELAAMYDNYRVHAVKTIVDIQNTTASPIVAVHTYSANNSPPTNLANLMGTTGNPYSVWGTAGLNSANASIHLENYVGLRKLVGSKTLDYDADYAGLNNANPTKQLFGYLSVTNANPTATALTFSLVIQIEFWCEWYGRQTEIT